MIIPVEWTDEGVEMLDQRLLPTEEKWLMLKTYTDVAKGIKDMVVRGAPAIGVSAAYGIALGAKHFVGTSVDGPRGRARLHLRRDRQDTSDGGQPFLGDRPDETHFPKGQGGREICQRDQTDP